MNTDKIEVNCPKCLEIVIAEKDFIGCYICPKCNCVVAKCVAVEDEGL